MIIPTIEPDEIVDLRSAIRGVLERSSGPAPAILERFSSGSSELWRACASEIGVAGLGVDPRLGGDGADRATLLAVAHEMGRRLAPVPLLSTVFVGTELLVALGNDATCDPLIEQVASGSTTLAVAARSDAAVWDERTIEVTARLAGQEWLLNGSAHFVLSGSTADVFLVPAKTAQGVHIFSLPRSTAARIETLCTLDLSRDIATISFESTPARLLSTGGRAESALAASQRAGVLGLVGEQLGAAEAVTTASVQYARDRHQFGRPIGSFQAIKHRLVDMVVAVERMKSVADALATCDRSALPETTHLAKIVCADAFFRLTADAIQVHGGIGFTWEHMAHRYFRRAKADEALFGSADEHRRRLLDLKVPTYHQRHMVRCAADLESEEES